MISAVTGWLYIQSFNFYSVVPMSTYCIHPSTCSPLHVHTHMHVPQRERKREMEVEKETEGEGEGERDIRLYQGIKVSFSTSLRILINLKFQTVHEIQKLNL